MSIVFITIPLEKIPKASAHELAINEPRAGARSTNALAPSRETVQCA
jgi:hypothetical protein